MKHKVSSGFVFGLLTSSSVARVVSQPMLELMQTYLDVIGVKMKISVMD